MKTFIFNSSMPRSGSELLQVVLDQNPEIYGSATSPLLGFCEGARNHMTMPEVESQPAELMKSAMLSYCKFGMSGFYEPVTDKPIICDKSRGWMIVYDWLQAILGEKPKMLCMVRDLREVLANQETVWRANRHLPIDNGLMVEQRVENWLTESHIAAALQRLYDADIQGYLDNIHCIKFEDFTTDPETAMQEVYEYLELPYFKHDFSNVVKKVEENHRVHGVFGNHDVKPVISPRPPKADKILGRTVSENIVANNPWFFNKFYK